MSNADDTYLTLAQPCQAELTEQRSRFLGFAAPCTSSALFRDFLDRISAEQPGATHYCWAYRLGFPDQPIEHHSDAGEPSGSAGPPIASALLFHHLWNVAIIVVRYFGGVKLGIPGLIDAYRRIARLTIEAGQIVPRRPMCAREFRMPYTAYNTLNYHLQRHGGWWSDAIFAADVRAVAHVPRTSAAAFDAAARAAGAQPVPNSPAWQNE